MTENTQTHTKKKWFHLQFDGKLAIASTAAGIIGGLASFYSDRGYLHLSIYASVVVGIIVLAISAYLESKFFKKGLHFDGKIEENDFKYFFTQTAFLYIFTWLLVNGILSTL